MSEPRVVRSPRGTQLTCKSWLTEAAYRMIQNNLDPEVAERPQDLVVYGGRGLAARGLIMYGQMTAGSWIYIGTQGILQGTYETLAALAVQKGWPSLKGKFVLTAGLGGMGGAQPLAVTMNEGVALVVEVDPALF